MMDFHSILWLKRDGLSLPKNPSEVSKQVRGFANEQKTQTDRYSLFQDMVKQGVRFSLTIDEYTSKQHNRFMSINVHGAQTYWNLGIVKIHGSEFCIFGRFIEDSKHNEEDETKKDIKKDLWNE